MAITTDSNSIFNGTLHAQNIGYWCQSKILYTIILWDIVFFNMSRVGAYFYNISRAVYIFTTYFHQRHRLLSQTHPPTSIHTANKILTNIIILQADKHKHSKRKNAHHLQSFYLNISQQKSGY